MEYRLPILDYPLDLTQTLPLGKPTTGLGPVLLGDLEPGAHLRAVPQVHLVELVVQGPQDVLPSSSPRRDTPCWVFHET